MTGYINSIALLRAVAALLVLLFHLSAAGAFFENPAVRHFVSFTGTDGVRLFFIVSGFVIPYALYNSGYEVRQFFRFMLKRMTRLEPPYFVSIALAIILWLRFGFSENGMPLMLDGTTAALHIGYSVDIARYLGFSANWYVPVYWTLAYEFQFYICVGLAFPILSSRRASIRVFTVLFLITAKSVLPITVPVYLTYAEFFAFGIVLFQRRVGLSGTLEAGVLLSGLLVWTGAADWHFAAYGPLVVFLLLVKDVNWTLTRFLGQISYSLYLTHYTFGLWFLGALITKLQLTPLHAAAWAALASIALAAILYYVIERPSLLLSQRVGYFTQLKRSDLRRSPTLANIGIGLSHVVSPPEPAQHLVRELPAVAAQIEDNKIGP